MTIIDVGSRRQMWGLFALVGLLAWGTGAALTCCLGYLYVAWNTARWDAVALCLFGWAGYLVLEPRLETAFWTWRLAVHFRRAGEARRKDGGDARVRGRDG